MDVRAIVKWGGLGVMVVHILGLYTPTYDPAAQTESGQTDGTILDEVLNTVSSNSSFIEAWADAITRHEGWYPGSHSYRNNNPGNLRVVGDMGADSSGFGIFSTYAQGRAALTSDLRAKVRKYSGWTLYQVMSRYAPPQENNTTLYAAKVAQALGVTPATQVGQIEGAWQTSGIIYSAANFPFSDATNTQTQDVAAITYGDGTDYNDPSAG